MFVESAVPAARKRRSSDASNAKTNGNLATLLGGEVNVLSVHRTSLPSATAEASGSWHLRFPVFCFVSRDFPAFPGRLSVVLLPSSRRPSISTTSRGGSRPTLDAEEEAHYALFACAAFPVRKRLVSASRSMDDDDGEDEDDDSEGLFSGRWRRMFLLSSGLSRSVSPHSSKPH